MKNLTFVTEILEEEKKEGGLIKRHMKSNGLTFLNFDKVCKPS